MSVQVPQGYKQTEVGMIPEDWDLIKLGDVCEIKGRIGFRGYTVNDIVEKGYGAISISPSNINNGKINFERSTYISFDKYEESPEIKIFNGDIVLVKTGSTFGKVALVEGLFEKATLNPQVVVIKKIKINNLYLSFLMGFENFQSQISSSVVGGALPTLSQKLVEKFKIPCPPTLFEQMAVGEALSHADALIESLEQLIAKKSQIKKGAMQELLTGQRRLPGFSGEWIEAALGDLFEITSSKRVFQSEWKSEGIPFYRARELAFLGEHGFVDNELFISKSMYESFKSAYGVPKKGDMLVTGVGTLGKVYVVDGENEFYFKDGNIIWFKIGSNVCAMFLKQLYLTPLIKKQIFDSAAGTTVGTYTISGAKKTKIQLPSLNEQIAIAEFLDAMDKEISLIEVRLNKSKKIKQAMMQELLTGRIRLI